MAQARTVLPQLVRFIGLAQALATPTSNRHPCRVGHSALLPAHGTWSGILLQVVHVLEDATVALGP
eukprot:8822942-Lingulodinium_polyedra.AAC.1